LSATQLQRHSVERVWGRRTLPGGFAECAGGAEPIGEIWFDPPSGATAELLVKYLFTSERLSIQVHPDDAAAQALGHPRGKDEAWFILDAEPGAVIGLGLVRKVSREELREAALSGAIEQLIDWKPVRAGETIYSPAGTIHAIGPGLSLIEIQQNLDLTYRLYDYGRPRELHVDEAVAVAVPGPFPTPEPAREPGGGRERLAQGAFVLERWSGACIGPLTPLGPLTLIPLKEGAMLDGHELAPGSVWQVEDEALFEAGDGADLLAAWPARN
jgi:mannose-6-phosphate isomerase